MCLPALGLLWAFLGVAVRQGARSGVVASVPRAPRAQRSPVLRVGAAGATGWVCVLSRRCLWNVPRSAAPGGGRESCSTHCLSARFALMCKLSLSKAFRGRVQTQAPCGEGGVRSQGPS